MEGKNYHKEIVLVVTTTFNNNVKSLRAPDKPTVDAILIIIFFFLLKSISHIMYYSFSSLNRSKSLHSLSTF